MTSRLSCRRAGCALLAVLATTAGREAVSVDRLAAAVWSEDMSVDARANLQSNVRRLRRLLGADHIATREAGLKAEAILGQLDPPAAEQIRALLQRAHQPSA